jgi:hypothetical protein
MRGLPCLLSPISFYKLSEECACGSSFVEPKGGAVMELPKCQKCNNGLLIPLSDYGQEGASVIFKAWACTNPDCGFSLRVDKGEITYGKRIEPKH